MNQKPTSKRHLYNTLHSIKTQLAVSMLLAALLPLAIATLINSQTIEKEALSRGHQALKNAAQQTAQCVDSFVEKGLYHGTASAALPKIVGYLHNPETADSKNVCATLQSIQRQNPVFIRHVTLFDPEGHALAASCTEGMQSSHFALTKTLADTVETGMSMLSPVHFDEGHAYICFFSPVLKNGKPLGLLRISYSATILQQLIAQHTGLLDPSSFPILVTDDGLQIANGILPHGNTEKLYILCDEAPAEATIQSLRDRHHLPGNYKKTAQQHPVSDPCDDCMSESVSMKSMPWTVRFFQSEEVLLRPIHRQEKNILLLGGGLALIAILAALWIAKKLTTPLQQLTKIALRSTEEMQPLPLTIQSKNEIGILAQSFNRLFEVLSLKQTELAESEENLRITLDSIGDCVITTDTEGRITGMNPAAEALVEQTLLETKGKALPEILPLFDSKTKEPINDITRDVLESGITLNLPAKAILILPDGREKFVADSAAPIRDPNGKITGCVLAIRDITEKHQMEIRLAQSQKMDALGQMAGGIAHDFNNMLTPILGAAELLDAKEVSEEERKSLAKMIFTAGQRTADLTQQMLTFSRKAPTQMDVLDLREIMDESRGMLQHAIGSNISIRTQRPLQPMMTFGDSSQIQNIFFNLALNARDAMQKTGTLTFQIKQIRLDSEFCRLHSNEVEPGSYIEVQIADTGAGIDPENLSKIFDPFFTTKETGKGTGLGLASVYGVMKKHKGMVNVYSEKGHGTVFHLYFPKTQKIKSEPPDTPPDKPKGSPKILLIDDNETVRKVTTALLETLGYTVLCAAGGAEGIDLYTTHQQEISLIMLDLVMPKMNGEETFSNLRKIDPDATVLIISGFDAEESVAGLLEAGAAGFLQKPFQLTPLAKALQRAILTRP